MNATERQKTIAHMTTALLIAFEITPALSRRLHAYHDAGLPLEEIDTSMDRQAVLASISRRLRSKSA